MLVRMLVSLQQLPSDLSEGSSNLYYTDARADARVALIVDSAPGTLNTLNELAAALGDDANFSTTVTNSIATKLPLAGGTMTGNLNLGNNIKAQFGAGNDLQIYHNAGTSFITESGSATLKIGGENLYLQNTAHNENYLAAIANQGVTLYYNNLAKIATTSTGIDVTGTADVTLDLNVGGAVKGNAGTRAVSVGVAGSVVGGLQLWSTTAGTSYVQFGDEAGTAANHYRGYMSYSHANDSMALGTSGNTKVTVSSAGNVGIGVVPKVWHSSAAVLQIGSGGSLEASTTNESRGIFASQRLPKREQRPIISFYR